MLLKFFTKKTPFFDLFDKHVELAKRAAQKFHESLTDPINVPDLAAISAIEHEADKILKETSELLHTTFITPIDSDLIFRLVNHVDDVIDCIDTAADCMLIYHIQRPTQDLIGLSTILDRSVRQLEIAVKGLRNLKDPLPVQEACTAVGGCEHDADDALRLALGQLFKLEPDAKEIIKWKEIYEIMEEATDRCADVTDVIQSILLENL